MNILITRLARESGIQIDYSGSPVVDRQEYLQLFAEKIVDLVLSRTDLDDLDIVIIKSLFKAK